MNCINCGAHMEGDGYKRVLHYPEACEEDFQSHEPDADAVYCRHVTDEVSKVLNGANVTSIPKLIKQYGSMAKVYRLLEIHEMTVAKYRFDRDCEKHIVINWRLYTVRSGYVRGGEK